MAHIHSKKVIHGDLTPTNILLKNNPDPARTMRLTAKIADFGLCATMAPGKTHISNIRNGGRGGGRGGGEGRAAVHCCCVFLCCFVSSGQHFSCMHSLDAPHP